MSKELWLLRHGKSDRDAILPDRERPLKKRGKRSAHRMGAWMRQHDLIPDRILSSPAERALATAVRVGEELKTGSDAIIQDERLYASSAESIKNVISECPGKLKRVLVVGHNPELEQLLLEMVGAENLPFNRKLMPTAALARLELPRGWDDLEPGCAKLLGITYVKALFDENGHK